MAKQYSVKDFFRQMPNVLLARYFHKRNLFTEFDFNTMKEGKPDDLFAAWLELSDGERQKMDTEFREIFELSSEKGFRAILDEATWHLEDDSEALTHFITTLSDLPSHFDRAMTTFLDCPEFWRGATRFHHADTLPYWRKRKNMGHGPAAVDEVSIQRLAILIRDYFHHTEGRGKNCVVDPFRRGDLDYFFAYPEDYSQQSIEWVNGEFDRRPHNPAFEIIFVYNQKEGSLDLNYRGNRKAVEPLQGMFATAILNLEQLPPDPKDERIYDLSPLMKKEFDFVATPGSGVETVRVKKLRLSSKINKGERITLEADSSNNPNAIYDLLERIKWALPFTHFNITQVDLAASVVVDVNKPPKTTTIRLTYPNSCSLKYDEIGLKLRDVLEASGLEPKVLDEVQEEEAELAIA